MDPTVVAWDATGVTRRPHVQKDPACVAFEVMGATVMTVTFHGVRGSAPCHGPSTVRYGGNTSCVSLHVEGEKPILLDLGSGLRYFGHRHAESSDLALDAHALVTHLHWDHIQGLPFFAPMLRPDARLVVRGPVPDDGTSFDSAVRSIIGPPTFPVTLDHFPGTFEFIGVGEETFSLGRFTVTSRKVPHIGATVGYRIEHPGASIAYISDHQQPMDGSKSVPDGVLDLVDGVDLLIHDSQYTPGEFEMKKNWGHCTTEYAVAVAAMAGAKRVALFHHDPDRSDDQLDAVAACTGSGSGVQVIVAREGMTLSI